jgi:1,4-dihydroxy-2-naphthoyl-CoA synthase
MDTVSVERDGSVLLIGLNRPEKRNAFTQAMLADLSRAYALLETDDSIRAGVLFAHGEHFTAGLDLVDVGPAIASGIDPMPEDGRDPWRLDGTWTTPLVAAAHGRCLTLGIELLLAADIRVAAADTRFAQIEVLRGIYPFGGATLRLPREVGWGNAMRWLLTGDEFDAAEAHTGWVSCRRSHPTQKRRWRRRATSPTRSPTAPRHLAFKRRSHPRTGRVTRATLPRSSNCVPKTRACSAQRTPRKASSRSLSAGRQNSAGARRYGDRTTLIMPSCFF